VSPCLDDATLHALLDRALPAPTAATCERHLALCAACRQRRHAAAHARDAVTALLAGASGPRRAAPAFASLLAQAAARRTDGAEPPLVAGLPQPDTRSAATAPARRVRTTAVHDGARSVVPARRRVGSRLLLPSAIGLAAAMAGFGVRSWWDVAEREAARIASVVIASAPAPRSIDADDARRTGHARQDAVIMARTGQAPEGSLASTGRAPTGSLARTGRAPTGSPARTGRAPIGLLDAPQPPTARSRATRPRGQDALAQSELPVQIVTVSDGAALGDAASASPQERGGDEGRPVVAAGAPVATVRIEVLDGSAPLSTVASDPATPTILAVPVSSASRLAAEEGEGRTARPVRTGPTFGAARSVPHPYVTVGTP
jgi:hypothetical protein